VRDVDGVDADYVMSGQYQLEVATERVIAKPFLRPHYDPDMKRIKI
jgi:4-methylaminobutanoate oxidase (formaldehyde-forming)